MKYDTKVSTIVGLSAVLTSIVLLSIPGRCDSSNDIHVKLVTPGKFGGPHLKHAPVTSPGDPIPLPKNYHRHKKY